MKHFTEREQIIIRGIINGAAYETYVLTNAFMDLLDGKGVAFDCQKGFLQFDSSKYNVSSILQVEQEFIETALLIQYLINNQYIYLIVDSQEPPLPRIGDELSNPVGKQIPRDIADIFMHSFVRIVVLNKLMDLVNNNFFTYEEQQLHFAQAQLNTATGSLHEAHKQTKSARKTLCWSIVTCFIALLTLLANILVPSCPRGKATESIESNSVSINNATGIDATSINTRLDLINNNILQLVEFSANLNNDFKIQPKIQINPRKRSSSQKASKTTQNKCSSVQPILKIDTINCDGETYWVLPCPPNKVSATEEARK